MRQLSGAALKPDARRAIERFVRESQQLDSFAVADVPSPAKPGLLIYVSDEAGGAVVAFSDGTDWRRVTDRAVIS